MMLGFACVPLDDRSCLSPSWDILTSELPLHPCPTASLGSDNIPEFPMCLPCRAGVPCGLQDVGQPSGTPAAGEGASPGHQHCPELGMQWSSNFGLGLVLLLSQPYPSVFRYFFKPYSFSPRHRVATHVWGTQRLWQGVTSLQAGHKLGRSNVGFQFIQPCRVKED